VTIKDREFDLLIQKFGFETRQGDHFFAWFEYKGKVILRTKRSHKRGDLPMQDAIRQQMKLNVGELREAIACTLGLPEYIELLRSKGLIVDEPSSE
jgi:hypothetical protein